MSRWHTLLLMIAIVYAIALLVLTKGVNLPTTTSAWASAIIAVVFGVVFHMIQG